MRRALSVANRVMNRWMAVGLAGSTVLCIVLATTVSATPPPGGVQPPPNGVDLEGCSYYSLDYARMRLGEAARATVAARKHGSLVEGETYWRVMDRARHRVTLETCGESIDVDICYGYRPGELTCNSYEADAECRSRVAYAKVEASLCAYAK
jgi:hypothetical protein